MNCLLLEFIYHGSIIWDHMFTLLQFVWLPTTSNRLSMARNSDTMKPLYVDHVVHNFRGWPKHRLNDQPNRVSEHRYRMNTACACCLRWPFLLLNLASTIGIDFSHYWFFSWGIHSILQDFALYTDVNNGASFMIRNMTMPDGSRSSSYVSEHLFYLKNIDDGGCTPNNSIEACKGFVNLAYPLQQCCTLLTFTNYRQRCHSCFIINQCCN